MEKGKGLETLLRENGYIEMDGDGLITLTAAGQAIAERV